MNMTQMLVVGVAVIKAVRRTDKKKLILCYSYSAYSYNWYIKKQMHLVQYYL